MEIFMTKATTCIIEKSPLVRAGLKSILDQSDFEVAAEVPHINDIAQESQYELVIFSAEKSADDIAQALGVLKNGAPDTRILVLSEFLDHAVMTASFSAGADGFLLKDISARALVASLELIMAGEKVFPTSMASLIGHEPQHWQMTEEADFDENADFSPKAVEIIRCLAGGLSNKLIARNLGITEATVKVHLKSILRKLELANRTQVAIWAVSHGIVPSAEKPHLSNARMN